MNKDSSINIRCETKLRKDLEEKAKEEQMPFADLVRWILRKATKE